MSNTHSVSMPVGTYVLGRILNARGEPSDQLGLVSSDAPRVPLLTAVATEEVRDTLTQMVETGIKPIDLLAPLPRGGVVAMLSEQGLGKMVVTEEIMHNFIAHHHGSIVLVAIGESTYEATELRDMIRDLEAEDKVVMVFEQREPAGRQKGEQEQEILRAGLTIAAAFSDDGHEVMLVVGKDIVTKDNRAISHELKQVARAKGITTLLFESLGDSNELVDNGLLSALDGQIVFSRALAKHNLWPAIDSLSTQSRLSESGVLSPEHVQVAREVKQLLRRYAELQPSADAQQLSSVDQQLWHRGQKVQFFLTQPFSVAEAYTDLPGEYLPVEETVNSFKALVEGRYDEVPDQSFYFVGTIKQALAKAGKY